MKINTNISSLRAQRYLQQTSAAIQRTLESLSSGKRITSARVDASGLAVSSGLEAQRRGINQAIRNLNDGRGFLETADGALSVLSEMIQRMRELAIQAANGALGNEERNYLQNEMTQLLEEYDRVVRDTNFNGTNLLDGSFSSRSLQIGSSVNNQLELSLGSVRSNEVFVKSTGNFEFGQAIFSGQPGQFNVARVDLDNDGDLDLIEAGDQLIIWKLNEEGEVEGSDFSGTADIQSLVTGDFNGDGFQDVVVGYDNLDGFQIFYNDRSGNFSTSTQYAGGSILDMKVGDLNMDGIDDLVVFDYANAGWQSWMGNENSSLSLSGDYLGYLDQDQSDAAYASQVDSFRDDFVLEDFNQDGFLDMYNWFGLRFGNGDGTFQPTILSTAWDGATYGTGLVDADGDGAKEVLVSSSSGLQIGSYHNGEFSFRSLSSTMNFLFTRAADIDGDGDEDFVGMAEQGVNSYLVYFENDGDGNFSQKRDLSATYTDFEWGDQNNDGIMDAFATTGTAVMSFTQQHPERSALDDLNISTQTKAQNSLSILDAAQDKILEARAQIGADMSRMDSAANILALTAENIAAAYSQIADTDIASTTAELVKLQVLQQAQIAILGQANVEMQIVLTLLDRRGR